METPTVRRVRARGLQARTPVVGRVPSRGVQGCEITGLVYLWRTSSVQLAATYCVPSEYLSGTYPVPSEHGADA